MIANREVAAALIDACAVAGVDPETAFEHLDDNDVSAYADALSDGRLPADHLPLFMRSLGESIQAGRCLCERCRADRRPS